MSEGRNAEASRRMPGEAALAAHAVAAAFTLVLAPRGFPVAHPRFWTNSALPLLLLLVAGAALVVLLRERPRWGAVALVGLAGAWVGAAATALTVFPASLAAPAIGGFAVALMLIASAVVLPQRSRLVTPTEGLAAAAGIVVGALFVLGLRPADPTTAPMAEATTLPTEQTDAAPAGVVGEELVISAEPFRMAYRPLLTFDRVSRDGFWSLGAPPSVARVEIGGAEGVRRFDDGAIFSVRGDADAATLDIDASTPVATDTYSHLNSYGVFTLQGCRRPSVSFSPTGAQQFDVRNADYPTGDPARFACLDDRGRFGVFEASSGEKGPFRELASGALARDEPLKIQFYDDGDWVASLTLRDWAAQASTALSPTAGWGAPQNAIEFQRVEPDGAVTVWASLASTSVGRGWDTVGHAAGVYRNRSRIEWRSASGGGNE